jgi:hypothetical protein
MSLEEIWYESSPYVYALLSVVVVLSSDGTLATLSGCMLLAAAATIIRLRWKHRQQRATVKAAAGSREQSAARPPSPGRRVRAGSAGIDRAR